MYLEHCFDQALKVRFDPGFFQLYAIMTQYDGQGWHLFFIFKIVSSTTYMPVIIVIRLSQQK